MKSSIVRDETFTGHVFVVPANGLVYFKNLSIWNDTTANNTGAAIYGVDCFTMSMGNMRLVGGQYGVLNNGCGGNEITGLVWNNSSDDQTAIAGIMLDGGATNPTNIKISDSQFYTNSTSPTIIVREADGLTISDSNFGSGTYQLWFQNDVVGNVIGNVYVDNNIFDDAAITPIVFGTGGDGTGAYNNISIKDSHIHGQNTSTGACVSVQSGWYGDHISLSGNYIAGCGTYGIQIAGATNETPPNAFNINGNMIIGNALDSAVSGVILATGVQGVNITGNIIGNNTRYVDGQQTYGIEAAGTLTDSQIVGNVLNDNDTGGILLSGALTNVVIANNQGVDDVIPTVASSATISAPVNPIFKISGTTQITTINGDWDGKTATLIFTDASPGGVGTGGNISQAVTVTQNQALQMVSEGGTWYVDGEEDHSTATMTMTNKTLDDLTNEIDANGLHAAVRNVSGAQLDLGDVVYISGYNIGQNLVEVELADNDDVSKMPAFCVIEDNVANNATGQCNVAGRLSGVNTLGMTVGDAVYVDSTAGGFTNTRPTGASSQIQKIGIVLRVHTSLGVIGVVGAGRTNDVPNHISTESLALERATYPVLDVVRTTATTTAAFSVWSFGAKTSGDMADTFGPGMVFTAEDDTSGVVNFAGIYALRDGGDDTAKMEWWLAATSPSWGMKAELAANGDFTVIGGLTGDWVTWVDSGSRPTCDSGERGKVWFDEGAGGVKDDFSVCAKDAGDAYSWRTIY
jgi:hypothetical protein